VNGGLVGYLVMAAIPLHPKGKSMDLLDHMRTFVLVGQCSSFTRAAKELSRTVPAVSKSISRLESHLNAELLSRTTRKVALTAAGRDFFNRCLTIIAGVDDAVQTVTDSKVQPEGHLRIHTPSEIGRRYLIPLIADYRRAFPLVTFDLTLENRIPDLCVEDFDVSVSVTPHVSSQWTSRNVGATYSVLCASPDYIAAHGMPQVPEDLAGHECIRPFDDPANTLDSATFEGPYGPVNLYIPPSEFHLNTRDGLVDAISSGLGIGCIPAFVAAEHLADGRLVRVLPLYHLESNGIHAVYRPESNSQTCIRSWTAYLGNNLPRLMASDLQARSA
jgi:DNA-binding transcriptional LysR family regulator